MPSKQSRGAERRRAPRRRAAGEVRLRQSCLLAESFAGSLLDSATGGFRARHRHLNLTSGQIVDFEFQGRRGHAYVVWTRIVDGEAETGFRILPDTAV